jgi:hypothetical protein
VSFPSATLTDDGLSEPNDFAGWIGRLSSADLVTDRRSGNEIVACIQAFLDERGAALPEAIKRTRTARLEDDSQNSEFGSIGLMFSDVDLIALGGEPPPPEPELAMDAQFAEVRTRIWSFVSEPFLIVVCAVRPDRLAQDLPWYLFTVIQHVLRRRRGVAGCPRSSGSPSLHLEVDQMLGRLRMCRGCGPPTKGELIDGRSAVQGGSD